jgi:hypothetical protein
VYVSACLCCLEGRGDTLRRLLTDGLWSLCAGILLLFLLTALDPRVRDLFAWRTATRPTEDAIDAGKQIHYAITLTYRTARDQAEEHQALLFFTVAGGVLLLFMLRT